MYVYMRLFEMNNKYVIYAYGYNSNDLDGRIKIPLDSLLDIEFLVESKDKNVHKGVTMKAIPKLIKALQKGEVPEVIEWACG